MDNQNPQGEQPPMRKRVHSYWVTALPLQRYTFAMGPLRAAASRAVTLGGCGPMQRFVIRGNGHAGDAPQTPS